MEDAGPRVSTAPRAARGSLGGGSRERERRPGDPVDRYRAIVARCGSSGVVVCERGDEFWDAGCGDCPDLFGVDSVVVEGENDPQSDDVVPWHLGVASGCVTAEQIGSFAGYFKQPFGGTAQHRVGESACGDDINIASE